MHSGSVDSADELRAVKDRLDGGMMSLHALGMRADPTISRSF